MMHLSEEAGRCLFCADAPCSKACPKGQDPARALRAVRFYNEGIAGAYLDSGTCEGCSAPCEAACIHYDLPIRIREVASVLKPAKEPAKADLSIDFCGLHCENPFFLASSAVCTGYDMIARAFEAGWGGVFYKTICFEDINEVSPRFDSVHGDRKNDFIGFRNMEQLSENTPEADFEILSRLKKNYPGKIVIASIMGQNEDEWIKLARMTEEAGLDGVELNFSCPQMKYAGMGSDVGQNSELVAAYTSIVKKSVSIPVIPKMTPNIMNITAPTMAAHFAGADGISAINTIKSITMSPTSAVNGKKTISGYSGKAVKPIALRHIFEISTNPYIRDLQISGVGGIETWWDALDFIRLGCRNVQVCTAVMEFGYRIIDDLVAGVSAYMAERGITRLEDLVNEQLKDFALPDKLDRSTVVFPVFDRDVCIGCGRCWISCNDGGHQAIEFGEDRRPRLIGSKCVGCHLCRLVCPTRAIGISKRVSKRSQ